MAEQGATRREFWVGTTITVFTVLVNIYVTNLQIANTKEENRRTQSANLLKEISSSINAVCTQLESHAIMYLEMEKCLRNRNQPERCWNRDYSFDVNASQIAWGNLSVSLNSASPHVSGETAKTLLPEIKRIPKAHQDRMKPLLAPRSVEDAKKGYTEILDTMNTLLHYKEQLAEMVALPVRPR